MAWITNFDDYNMIVASYALSLNETDIFYLLANFTKYYLGLFKGFSWIIIYFTGPHQLYFKLPSI